MRNYGATLLNALNPHGELVTNASYTEYGARARWSPWSVGLARAILHNPSGRRHLVSRRYFTSIVIGAPTVVAGAPAAVFPGLASAVGLAAFIDAVTKFEIELGEHTT